jgi:hypothetical protein
MSTATRSEPEQPGRELEAIPAGDDDDRVVLVDMSNFAERWISIDEQHLLEVGRP